MEIKSVIGILNKNNLGQPNLKALIPDAQNYKTFILQPQGEIEADSLGVRNKNKDLANQQFSSFLNSAFDNNSELVITPEYSLPWSTLVDCLNNDIKPKNENIWALGCESIKYSELEDIKQQLAAKAVFLHENLEADNERYIDPLVYVFNAPSLTVGEENKLVVLVQFKTHPMGDKDHFEVNGLQLGHDIYKFGGNAGQLSLISFICSDAFNIEDSHATDIHDRSLIIHIQLNPSPRHPSYRLYREKLFKFANDEIELICLNWAQNVNEWQKDIRKDWENISASAWYSKSKQFDVRDNTLRVNHKRGLYYTWCQPLMCNVLFLNYEAGSYLFTATKVAHIGVIGAISQRRGPQLEDVCSWDNATALWKKKEFSEDGFANFISESENAKDALNLIYKECPLKLERILALSVGKNEELEQWHDVRKLDSFGIDASEVVRRITFCQDTDENASTFRISRLKRCGTLWEILNNKDELPEALADFRNGFNLTWSNIAPHQNAISSEGKFATLIYMGEDCSLGSIEATSKRMSEILNRSFADSTDSHNAKQRLAVWYRNAKGEILQFNPDKFIKFDDPGTNNEVNLGRED